MNLCSKFSASSHLSEGSRDRLLPEILKHNEHHIRLPSAGRLRLPFYPFFTSPHLLEYLLPTFTFTASPDPFVNILYVPAFYQDHLRLDNNPMDVVHSYCCSLLIEQDVTVSSTDYVTFSPGSCNIQPSCTAVSLEFPLLSFSYHSASTPRRDQAVLLQR